MSIPRILITNDDGIHSPGLTLLAKALEAVGEVWVIAPDRERSAISHAITINHPIRMHRLRERVYICDGTPADCVLLGVRGFLEDPPHLVISGINRGPNLGIDTNYSGTVAGAHEGRLCGVPSFAISLNVTKTEEKLHFETAARFSSQLAADILERGLPDDIFLNVNVPNIPFDELNGVAIAKLGQRIYRDVVVRRTDPQGRDYYWIGGDPPTWAEDEDDDFHAILQNRVSITPLGRDFMKEEAFESMQTWTLANVEETLQ